MKMIHFDYDDKDKLAQALQIFEKLGYVDAPDAFKIRPFKPRFSFDLDRFLTLQIAFDYGDFQITSFRDLDTLDFSRHLRLEKRIFDLLKRSGFSVGFETQVNQPKGEEIYAFFTEILPQFAKLGEVTLSPSVQELQITENFDIDIDQNGGLLEINFICPMCLSKNFQNWWQTSRKCWLLVTESGQLILLGEQFDAVKQVLNDMSDAVQVGEGKIAVPTFKTFQLSKIFGTKMVSHIRKNLKPYMII